MTTSGDMLAMLRRHYLPESRPAGGLFADEIASPDGRRRADLIWVPTTSTASHTARIIGHEIKVTRSDVLVELADPTKHDPWAQYCGRWWLVVATPELIMDHEIPDGWGVMAPPSGRRTRSMTIVKPAPALHPRDTGPALSRIAAYVVGGIETRTKDAEREAAWARAEVERLRRQVEELRLSGVSSGSPHAARLARIVAAVGAQMSEQRMFAPTGMQDAAIIEAASDLIAARLAARETLDAVDRARRDVLGLVDPFRYATSALEKAHERLSADTGVTP